MYAGYVVRFSVGAPFPTTVVCRESGFTAGGRESRRRFSCPGATSPFVLDFSTKPTHSGLGKFYVQVLVGRSVEILVKRLSCDFGAVKPSCF